MRGDLYPVNKWWIDNNSQEIIIDNDEEEEKREEEEGEIQEATLDDSDAMNANQKLSEDETEDIIKPGYSDTILAMSREGFKGKERTQTF